MEEVHAIQSKYDVRCVNKKKMYKTASWNRMYIFLCLRHTRKHYSLLLSLWNTAANFIEWLFPFSFCRTISKTHGMCSILLLLWEALSMPLCLNLRFVFLRLFCKFSQFQLNLLLRNFIHNLFSYFFRFGIRRGIMHKR